MALTAAQKRARTAKGRRRAPARRDLWTANAKPRRLGREDFKVVLHRTRRRLPPVSLDGLVTHMDWGRTGTSRTAEINFQRPLSSSTGLIYQGDTIALYVDEDGNRRDYKPVWRMVVNVPEAQLQQGIVSVALEGSLAAVNKSKVAWKFTTGKKRRRPWHADEITRAAARRLRVPLGRIARGGYPIKKLILKKATLATLVARVYELERRHTGRRFDVDTSTGRLEVLELRESRDMLLLGKAILDGTVKRSTSNLATALVVTSSAKKGKRRHGKVRVKVVDKKRTRRYGYIVQTVEHGGLRTRSEAIAWAKKHLARMTGPRGDVTFTHPGMPFLDRGQAVRLYLPEEDLHQIAFVRSVRHTLSAGSYEMEVTVGYSDPYRDALKAQAAAKRRAAARRRKRASHDRRTHAPKPKKAARRG